jgi:uncharacterized protein
MDERPVTERALYQARPTIRIDGDEHARVRELLRGLEAREEEGGMSSLELRFQNVASLAQGGAELGFEPGGPVKLGAKIAVYTGDVGSPQRIFSGTITALEVEFSSGTSPQLVVLAEDALQRARMTRRTRVHPKATVKKLAEDIARENGLKGLVTGFAAEIGTQVQLNESDLAFLRRILRAYDGDMQVVDEELHVAPRNDTARGELTLALYSQLASARVVTDLAQQRTEVSVAGWDGERGERVSATSRGVQLAPGEGKTGAELLQDALGARSEHLGHVAVATKEEAKAVADALFDQAARRFVCVHATTEGNPAVRVGTRVKLTGLGPRFDNTYHVAAACHRYDLERGYTTEFDAECAYLGAS